MCNFTSSPIMSNTPLLDAKDVKRGFVYWDRYGKFTVMAVADGWYMCRRPGYMVICYNVKDLVNAINQGRLWLSEADAINK